MKKLLQHAAVLLVMQISIFSQAGSFIGSLPPDSLTGNGYTWSTPLIMDGKYYWAGQDQGVMAFDLETKENIWTDTLDFMNGTYHNPVGYDGKIFIGRQDYSSDTNYALIALDALTGEVIWQKLGFIAYNSRCNKPIDPQEKTIFAAETDSLYCFNIDDGSVVWQDSGTYNQLVLDYKNQALYAARADSAKIAVINSVTGEFVGNITMPDSMSFVHSMGLTTYQSNQYLVTMTDRSWLADSTFSYCFNLTTQKIVWSSSKIGYLSNSVGFSIMDGMVFAGVEKPVIDTTQYVRAFNLLDGEVVWEIPVGRSYATNTAYTVALDGKVYFESNLDQDKVMCVDAATGNEVWSAVPGEGASSEFKTWGSPLIYDNTLFMATDAEGIFWFDAGDVDGEWLMAGCNILGTYSYVSDLSTDVEDEINSVPTEFSLNQNYPNPFNPTTKISFSVAKEGKYELKVYNVLGQLVTTLVNKEILPGSYSIDFSAGNLASGVYIYSLTGENVNVSKKMMLLK